jgi:hypothetical protein
MTSEAMDIAMRYFDVSNKSDMEAIYPMFRASTTYSSQNTGVYLGAEQIIDMQRKFHSSFDSLRWDIHSVEEPQPGVVKFDFTFIGQKKTGDSINLLGVEYIIVYNGKIQHVEIRNK